jgi:hypothetical protein
MLVFRKKVGKGLGFKNTITKISKKNKTQIPVEKNKHQLTKENLIFLKQF